MRALRRTRSLAGREVAGDLEGNPYIRFAALSRLHFASLVVLPDEEWGPYLVCEVNVDGPIDGFLRELFEHGVRARSSGVFTE